jgi:hypothetical protein
MPVGVAGKARGKVPVMFYSGARHRGKSVVRRLARVCQPGGPSHSAMRAREHKPIGEVLRELVRERVERKRRRAFEREARRQSSAAAALASDPNSDEAAVMRELEADLAEFTDEWK